MLQKVTIANPVGEDIVIHEDGENSQRLLTGVKGLVGVGPLRDSKRVRPTAHGAINETKYEDGRAITLEGEVWSTVSVAQALEEFRAMVQPLLQTLDVGPALLKWQEGSTGLALQRLVKLDSDCEPLLKEAAAILPYQCSLYAEDPVAYSQALTTTKSGTLGAGVGGLTIPAKMPWKFKGTEPAGRVTLSQNGNRPSPPVFRIYGRALNPTITKLSTGAKLSLTNGSYEITDGNYVEINIASRTIKLNGVTRSLSGLNPASTTWSEMYVPAKGSSETFTLSAPEYDNASYLEVIYRSAYA